MSTAIVTNQVYPIGQDEEITITNDRTTFTVQIKYADASTWVTHISGGSDTSYTLPRMNKGEFKATVQTGGNEARFDICPRL